MKKVRRNLNHVIEKAINSGLRWSLMVEIPKLKLNVAQ